MRNNLPQLASNHNKQLSNKQISEKTLKNCSRINVKGITLKQYFRICDENHYQQPITEMEQQCQSKSSNVETPSFNVQHTKRQGRDKIKTQITEEVHISNYKLNFHSQRPVADAPETVNRSAKLNHFDKNNKLYYVRQNNQAKKKQERKKIMTKVNTNATKIDIEINNNNVTLSSFYQHEDNKKKMLKKMQVDKQRANEYGDLRLSDAFFITKYGSKFNINQNIYKQG